VILVDAFGLKFPVVFKSTGKTEKKLRKN